MSETVLEDAAAQVGLELFDHELGQASGLLGALEKLRPVLLDQPVEQRLLGLATLVAVEPGARRACCGRTSHRESSVAASARCS